MKKVFSYIFIVAVFGIIALSCGESKKTQSTEVTTEDQELSEEDKAEKVLYDEVMAIHDSIMPLTDNMMTLKRELQAKLDSAKKTDKGTEALQPLEEKIKQLEEADEAMWQWMRNFEAQDKVENHDQVMAYYTLQMAEIKKVRTAMMSAMKNANQQLKTETAN